MQLSKRERWIKEQNKNRNGGGRSVTSNLVSHVDTYSTRSSLTFSLPVTYFSIVTLRPAFFLYFPPFQILKICGTTENFLACTSSELQCTLVVLTAMFIPLCLMLSMPVDRASRRPLPIWKPCSFYLVFQHDEISFKLSGVFQTKSQDPPALDRQTHGGSRAYFLGTMGGGGPLSLRKVPPDCIFAPKKVQSVGHPKN